MWSESRHQTSCSPFRLRIINVLAVVSRVMRKFVCRLWMNEVSRQWKRLPEPPPSASYSCTFCCPTGCRPHGAAGCRPASERSCHRGMSPPPASVGGSPGSAARSRCWYGCGSSARRENHSMMMLENCSESERAYAEQLLKTFVAAMNMKDEEKALL